MVFRAFDGCVMCGCITTLIAMIWLTSGAYRKREVNVFNFMVLPLIILALLSKSCIVANFCQPAPFSSLLT